MLIITVKLAALPTGIAFAQDAAIKIICVVLLEALLVQPAGGAVAELKSEPEFNRNLTW
jgi:hypothetical protein